MATFDETDMEILRLLLEDGRRPYSEIADRVDLSPPTVSDRVDRLKDGGVVERFTVDVNRSTLTDGVSVLVEITAEPEAIEAAQSGLREHTAVEHVFATASGRLYAKAHVDPDAARELVADAIDLNDVRSFDIHLLADHDWTPSVGTGAFDIECAECGNTVTSEGEFAEVDGSRYHFCCSSCESQFLDRYEKLAEA